MNAGRKKKKAKRKQQTRSACILLCMAWKIIASLKVCVLAALLQLKKHTRPEGGPRKKSSKQGRQENAWQFYYEKRGKGWMEWISWRKTLHTGLVRILNETFLMFKRGDHVWGTNEPERENYCDDDRNVDINITLVLLDRQLSLKELCCSGFWILSDLEE